MQTALLRQISAESGVVFGTSGARGLVSAMTDAVCYAYTQAFLKSTADEASEVVIGHDLRPSSPSMAAACAQAVRDAGKVVVYVGVLPTPAIHYYAAMRLAPSVIITGSHIPFDRNGIKFYKADGEITKADEERLLETEVPTPLALEPKSLPTLDHAASEGYMQRYLSVFENNVLAGKRVAVYEHSSVAREILPKLLNLLGAEVILLGRTDAFVPIDTEAVRPQDVEQAKNWAKSHQFDAIVSTDGDADRPLVGDENGNWLRGDIVGILCSQLLKADIVVAPVSCNTALEKCGAFREVLRTRIGSPYVIEGMQAAAKGLPEAVVVGYEANGGFLLGTEAKIGGTVLKALPTRDALLPILALLTMSAKSDVPVSRLANNLPKRFTASDRIQQVENEYSRQLITSFEQDHGAAQALLAPEAGEIVSRDCTDGLRLIFRNGEIVHLRPSGNAPELRCYTEADSPERAVALCCQAMDRVHDRVSKLRD